MEKRVLLSLASWCPDVVINQGTTTLGRGDTCDQKIAYAHISSNHCTIKCDPDGSVFLKDTSRNGTFINADKVRPDRFVQIKNGDHISLTPPGSHGAETVAFVFHDETSSGSRASVFDSRVDIKNIIPVKLLGKGAFGEVYSGVCNQEERAIKVVRKAGYNPNLIQEIRVLDKLRHPHIVGVHEVVETPEALIMTLDLASGGDLEKLLDNAKALNEVDSACLIKQLLSGLAYLHAQQVIHRDLKPANILLKHSLKKGMAPHLLITDFGLAALLDSSAGLARAKTVCGTPVYAAPEIVLAERALQSRTNIETYDERVDVWSTGILLFRMLTGKLPWESPAYAKMSLAERILSAASPNTSITKVALSITISPACRTFLDRLVVDRKERFSASEALSHEWLEAASRISPAKKTVGAETQNLMLDDENEALDATVIKRLSVPQNNGFAKKVKTTPPTERNTKLIS